MIERQDGMINRTTTNGYDADNRLVEEVVTVNPPGGGTAVVAKVLRRSYEDSTGRLLATWTSATAATATDLTSARTSARTLTEYAYDALGRLSTATQKRLNGVGVSLSTAYAYEDNSNLKSVTQPNGVVTTYGYDNLNRLKTTDAKKGGSTLFSQTYVLSPDGQRCRSATRRTRQNLRECGILEPNTGQDRYASGLTPDVERLLRALLAAGPRATRQVLRDRLGLVEQDNDLNDTRDKPPVAGYRRQLQRHRDADRRQR